VRKSKRIGRWLSAWPLVAEVLICVLISISVVLISIHAECRQSVYDSTPDYETFQKVFFGSETGENSFSRAVYIDTRHTMQGYANADSANLTRICDNLLFPENVLKRTDAWQFNYGSTEQQIIQYSYENLRKWEYVASEIDVVRSKTIMFDVFTHANDQLKNHDIAMVLTNEWVVFGESQYHPNELRVLQDSWDELREGRGVTLFKFLLMFDGSMPDQQNGYGARPLYLLLVGNSEAVFEETKKMIKILEDETALRDVAWNYITNVPSLQRVGTFFVFVPENSQNAQVADDLLFRGESFQPGELIDYVMAEKANGNVILYLDGDFPWKVISDEAKSSNPLLRATHAEADTEFVNYGAMLKNGQPVAQTSAVWYDMMNGYAQINGLPIIKISPGQTNTTIAIDEGLLDKLQPGRKYILEAVIMPEVAEPEFWLDKCNTERWYGHDSSQVSLTYYLTELFQQEHFTPRVLQEEKIRIAIKLSGGHGS